MIHLLKELRQKIEHRKQKKQETEAGRSVESKLKQEFYDACRLLNQNENRIRLCVNSILNKTCSVVLYKDPEILSKVCEEVSESQDRLREFMREYETCRAQCMEISKRIRTMEDYKPEDACSYVEYCIERYNSK